jgi:ABC-type bacteriocin/lantibiotic exporter with double-glycine peptidase domain
MTGDRKAIGTLDGWLYGVRWERVKPWFMLALGALVLVSVIWNVFLLKGIGKGLGEGAAGGTEYVVDIAKKFARDYWHYYIVQFLLIAITVPVAVIAVSKVSAEFTSAQSSRSLPENNRLGAWHILIAVLMFSFFLRIFRTFLRERVIPRATALISAELFDRYLKNYETARSETDEGVGEVLYTLRQVTEDITWLVVVWVTDIMSILVMLAVLTLFLARVSLKLGIAGLVFSLLIITIGALYNVRIIQRVIDFMNAERGIMSRGEQYVVNAATISAFNARADIGPDFRSYTDRLVRMRTEFTNTETGYNTVWRVLMLVFFAFVMYWCLTSKSMTRTSMQTLITVLFLLLYWLLDLGADLVDMAWRFASVINPYALKLFNTSPDAAEDARRTQAMDVPAGAKLEIRGMGFRYEPKEADKQKGEETEEAAESPDAEAPEDVPAERAGSSFQSAEPEKEREGGEPPAWTITPFDLSASPGERIVVKGNSGSGKSTMFKLLSGFETPTVGSVQLGAMRSSDVSHQAWRRHVLFVSQKWALFDGTILENMTIGTGVKGVTAEDMNGFVRAYGFDAVIPDVTQQVGNSASTGGGQMSGGMGKLITLTRATLRLMPEELFRKHFPSAQRSHPVPAVVLFDEPLAALDEDSRKNVRRLMDDLLGRSGSIAFYIMHNDDLDDFATRILRIADGQLTAERGPPVGGMKAGERSEAGPAAANRSAQTMPKKPTTPKTMASLSEQLAASPMKIPERQCAAGAGASAASPWLKSCAQKMQ